MNRVFRPIAASVVVCLCAFSQSKPSHCDSGAASDAQCRYRWPGGVIPYLVDSDVPRPERIYSAMQLWTDATPIRFVRRSNETNYVRFVRENNGGLCFSAIGRVGDEQKIRTDDKCETGTLAHELGHTIGLWHEQSRRDRDRFVRVLYRNISESKVPDFDRHINDEPDFSYYDYASIMRMERMPIPSGAMARVIETIPPGIPIGQRKEISPGDIDAVCHMYGFPLKYVTIATHVSGLKIIVDGVPYTSPQRFEWEAGARHSLEVPSEQTRNGTRYEFGRWNDDGNVAHSIPVSPELTIYIANFITHANAATANGRIGVDDRTLSQGSKQGHRTVSGDIDARREISAGGQDDRARDLHAGHASSAAN